LGGRLSPPADPVAAAPSAHPADRGLARDLLAPAPVAAARLLGCHLGADSPEGTVTVRITEVEAYAGEADPASHAARGRTPRTSVMYGPPGVSYVYFSYGVHWCLNIVTGPAGTASAVLVRGGEVVAGAAVAASRRPPGTPAGGLARGPGCLAQALGLGATARGVDLLAPGSPVRLTDRTVAPAAEAGPRVGVSAAADVRWRFWVPGEPSVSAYRRSPRAPRGHVEVEPEAPLPD